MKKIILVSKTPIIIQIFTLVCKKLSLDLEVINSAQLDHKVDIIVIDHDFIDDRFNILKTYSRRIGAISKEDLGFDIANDFLIPLPFLPSYLQQVLEEQITILNQKTTTKQYVSNLENDLEDDQFLKDEFAFDEDDIKQIKSNVKKDQIEDDESSAVEYLESLASGIATDINDESDDSIISISAVKGGGVLDLSELSKIEDLVDFKSTVKIDNIDKSIGSMAQEPLEDEDKEWQDLTSIIDQAILEVNSSDNFITSDDKLPIEVLLNKYQLDQLTPLLTLLDQNLIDMLSNGENVLLELKLEVDKSDK